VFNHFECSCFTQTTTNEGSWIFVCANCTQLGREVLARAKVAQEAYLQEELELLSKEVTPPRPLDVGEIPRDGTEAYFRS
jgi:hypothetical protein